MMGFSGSRMLRFHITRWRINFNVYYSLLSFGETSLNVNIMTNQKDHESNTPREVRKREYKGCGK